MAGSFSLNGACMSGRNSPRPIGRNARSVCTAEPPASATVTSPLPSGTQMPVYVSRGDARTDSAGSVPPGRVRYTPNAPLRAEV